MNFYIAFVALWTLYIGTRIYSTPNNLRAGENSEPRKATKPHWFSFLIMNTIFMPISLAISLFSGILNDDIKRIIDRR